MAGTYDATNSYWIESSRFPTFPSLDRDLTVDVVVIGGGLTGLTAGYLLKRANLRVAVLERRQCAEADTGLTTAHLTCVTDTRLSDLVATFGEDHARATWDAGLAAIALIDESVRREHIDCDFAWVPGYLHSPVATPATDRDVRDLKKDAETATALGFDAQFVADVPFVGRPGIEIADQARFHPRRYLAALARAINGDGSFVFEHTSVDSVETEPTRAVAGAHSVRADRIVIATHNPIVGKASVIAASLLQTKLSLYSSYVIAGRVAAGSVPDALFWDTSDPYLYFRIVRHHDADYVIFGGQDHKTGQAADTREVFRHLEGQMRRLFPDVEVTERWSGQVIETNDGLPLIGEMAEGQFAATGFSGNGMTFGTLGGMMAADWALDQQNPWTKLFDLHRTKVRGLWDYLKENKDYPYYMIRDRFAGAEARTLRSVRRGSGKIVDLKGTVHAAYRSPDGDVTLLSPTCTHLGCQVRWNNAEHTWDCPCHGSRFSPKGEVLSGPAERPLEESPSTSE